MIYGLNRLNENEIKEKTGVSGNYYYYITEGTYNNPEKYITYATYDSIPDLLKPLLENISGNIKMIITNDGLVVILKDNEVQHGYSIKKKEKDRPESIKFKNEEFKDINPEDRTFIDYDAFVNALNPDNLSANSIIITTYDNLCSYTDLAFTYWTASYYTNDYEFKESRESGDNKKDITGADIVVLVYGTIVAELEYDDGSVQSFDSLDLSDTSEDFLQKINIKNSPLSIRRVSYANGNFIPLYKLNNYICIDCDYIPNLESKTPVETGLFNLKQSESIGKTVSFTYKPFMYIKNISDSPISISINSYEDYRTINSNESIIYASDSDFRDYNFITIGNSETGCGYLEVI